MLLQAISVPLYCLFLYTNVNKFSVPFSLLLSPLQQSNFSSSGFALVAMSVVFTHKDHIFSFDKTTLPQFSICYNE